MAAAAVVVAFLAPSRDRPLAVAVLLGVAAAADAILPGLDQSG